MMGYGGFTLSAAHHRQPDNADPSYRRLQTHDEFRPEGARRSGKQCRARRRMLGRPTEQPGDD